MTRESRGPRTILLTGPPGVGKTTLMRKLHEHYVKHGVMVSGIITEEMKSASVRTGFRIKSLASGEEGLLASKLVEAGPKVGSYSVITSDLERVGARTLQNAARGNAPLVLIDEVGPMEMTNPAFRRALSEVFKADKITVATVKFGSRYDEVEQISRLKETKTFEITRDNRDSLFPELTSVIDAAISRERG